VDVLLESEENLYAPLHEWIYKEFFKHVKHSRKIKYVEITARNAYFRSTQRRRMLFPDVSAIDGKNKLIVFECKMKSPLESEQLFSYLSGTNYVYAVISESQKGLNYIRKMLEAIGVGLITYRALRGKYKFTLELESQDHKGQFSKSNSNRLKDTYEKTPKIIIFPHSRNFFPTKNDLVKLIEKYKNGLDNTYGHRCRKPLPLGSIVLFVYGTEIIGQAVVRVNRPATPEEIEKGKEQGYTPSFTFEPFKDLVCVFPKPVKLKELERFPTFAGKKLHSVARMYPYLSPQEYMEILSKALKV